MLNNQEQNFNKKSIKQLVELGKKREKLKNKAIEKDELFEAKQEIDSLEGQEDLNNLMRNSKITSQKQASAIVLKETELSIKKKTNEKNKEISSLNKEIKNVENSTLVEQLLEAIKNLFSKNEKPEEFEKPSNKIFNIGLNFGKKTKNNFESIKKDAEDGNAEAMYELGLIYYEGRGDIFIDHINAADWFKKAANAGFSKAILNRAICYKNGEGVDKDPEKYFELLEKAANAGVSEALLKLGICYEKGERVEKNEYIAVEFYKEAVKWFKYGRDTNDSDSMRNLGFCYEKGKGVKQKLIKAFNLYKKASELGNVKAMLTLGYLYFDKQDYKNAVEWYTKAAANGNALAMYTLGIIYRDGGNGVDKNPVEAKKCFKDAAKKEHVRSMVELGDLYYNKKDYKKAVELLEKAAKKGNAYAMYSLGWCYYHGEGVVKDYKKALGYYVDAHKNGYTVISLSHSHSKCTYKHLESIGELTSLKKLDLNSSEEITDAGLSHLKNLKNLEKLDLSWCEEITDAGLSHLKDLKKLEELKLYGCKKITPAAKKMLKNAIPGLKIFED